VGFLDRILGIESPRQAQPQRTGYYDPQRGSGTQPTAQAPNASPPGQLSDEQALERYRYMIKTAPPETIEQAHAEAFAKLTPEQRQTVLAQLADAQPPEERAAAQRTSADDPQAMGRLATRTEMRQPGFMERTLGGGGGGMGLGGTLLASFAMGFVGSMVANSFFSAMDHGGGADADVDAAGEPTGDIDQTQESEPVADQDQDLGGGGDDMDFGGGDFDI